MLQGAGAIVLGPCADAAEALAYLQDEQPDFAVLDLNLGGGANFDLARAIDARGIPMMFATGYDATSIPPEFANIPRLQKPINLRALVPAIAEIRSARTPAP